MAKRLKSVEELEKIMTRFIENFPFIAEIICSKEKLEKFVNENPEKGWILYIGICDLAQAMDKINNVFDEEIKIDVEDN